jgi:hypothetical protein
MTTTIDEADWLYPARFKFGLSACFEEDAMQKHGWTIRRLLVTWRCLARDDLSYSQWNCIEGYTNQQEIATGVLEMQCAEVAW